MAEPIAVRTVLTEDLTVAQRAAIIRVCVAAHQEDDFEHLFSYIPSGGRHVLGVRDDELISHAVATTRWLQPAGHPLLRTAYVDAVSTLPAFEGLGYASAVMRRLVVEVDDDFVIGCLQTERQTFYERLGWQRWRGALAGRGDDGIVPTPDETGVMVLRLSATPPLDLDALLTIEPQPARIW